MSTDLIDTRQTSYVRPMRPDDTEWAKALWRRAYGEPNDWALPRAVDDDRTRTAGFTAMVDDDRAGFGIALIAPVDWIGEEMDIDASEHVSHKLNGVLHIVAVERPYRGRGLASMLVRKRLQWLQGHDTPIHHALALSWLRDDHVSSNVVLQKFGFEPVAFHDNGLPDDRGCPDCPDACTCDAEVYVRGLRGETA